MNQEDKMINDTHNQLKDYKTYAKHTVWLKEEEFDAAAVTRIANALRNRGYTVKKEARFSNGRNFMVVHVEKGTL